MARSKQNTARGVPLSNDVTRSRRAQDTILSDQELLDAICRPNLGNQLYNFGVVVSPISSNHKKAALDALGNRQKDTRDEGLAIVGLLKDGDFLAKSGPGRISWVFLNSEDMAPRRGFGILTFRASGP